MSLCLETKALYTVDGNAKCLPRKNVKKQAMT